MAGRYVLRQLIGSGGMGSVYRADDEVLGRSVAVKEVPVPDSVPDAERAAARARVLREARAAARVDHHGAVTVHDVIEEVGSVFIVMELVAAPTLSQLVAAAGPLDPARVARLGRQVLDVLERVHAAGIVHRDVKPANVMVLPGDVVKVADFGIAAMRGDPQLTAAGMVLGSPSYMAPEQATGTPVGPEVDLWSLGATLYYAVEGRPPFAGDDPQEVLTAILVRDPEPPVRAGALAPALLAMLSREPQRRPPITALGPWLDAVAAGTAMPDPGSAGAGATTAPGMPTVTSVPVARTVTASAPAPPTPAPPEPAPPEHTPPESAPPGPETTEWFGGVGSGAAAAGLGVGPGARHPLTVVEEPTRTRPVMVLLGGGGLVLILLVAAVVLWANRPSDQPAADGPRRGAGATGSAGPTAAGGSATTSAPASGPGSGQESGSGPRSRSSSGAGSGQGSGPGSGQGSGSGSGGDGPGTGTPVALDLSTVAPSGQILPRFWSTATNPAGRYRIGVPASFWQVTAEGTSTYAEWPGDSMFEAAFEVHQHPSAQDPYALLRSSSAAFARAHAADQYSLKQLDPTWTFKRGPAAAWEYTWVRNGELTRARVVAFRSGGHTYSVLYRSVDLWWDAGGTSAFPTGFETAFTAPG